jgi:hypothetical protein
MHKAAKATWKRRSEYETKGSLNSVLTQPGARNIKKSHRWHVETA